MKKSIIAISMLLISTNWLYAQYYLAPIIVTATPIREAISNGLNLKQISAENWQQHNARNLQAVLAYEPGVSADNNSRGNLENIRIRGIGGDRVAISIDGVKLPPAYAFGNYLTIGRDYVEVDQLKAVDIVRGPATLLYGSGAIGGAIRMVTKDPEDYLRDDQVIGGYTKVGYASDQKAWVSSAALANRLTDTLSSVLHLNYRRSHELDNAGGASVLGETRGVPDPQRHELYSVMSKLVYTPVSHQKFIFSYTQSQQDNQTDILSKYHTVVAASRLHMQNNEETQKRQQASLRHEFSNPNRASDGGFWQLYWQSTQADQHTYEKRTDQRQRILQRERDSRFEQDLYGVTLQFHQLLAQDALSHYLQYGIDYAFQKVHTIRTGNTVEVQTRQSTETEIFPNQSFPDSNIQSWAIFAQNIIELPTDYFKIIPAIRYDHYRLTPAVSHIYLNANPGIELPKGLDKGHVSKQLSVEYTPNIYHTWRIAYSEGFKAPSFSAVNIGFSNTAQGYTTQSNPDLKPETSRNIELGFQYENDLYQFNIAAYHHQYQNFIDELSQQGRDPQTGLIIFQSRNLGKAVIQGIELQGSIPMGAWFNRIIHDNQSLIIRAGLAYAKGKNHDNDQPLDSVDPLNVALGIHYAQEDQWNINLQFRGFKGSSRLSEQLQAVGVKHIPGYGRLDLFGTYQLTNDLSLTAGIYNLTNQQYWDYGRRVTLTYPTPASLSRATAPGINAAIALRYTF